MRASNTAILLLASALTGCGPMFFAEVDVPQLCAVRKNAAFELYGPPVPLALSEDVLIDLKDALPESPEEADGRISRLRVIARSGIEDFGFVEQASLRLAPTDDPLSSAEVLTYQQDAQQAGPELQAEGERFDLQPLLRSGEIVAHVQLAGTPPPEPFIADVEVCLAARVRYAY